jgi:hypothetical protein
MRFADGGFSFDKNQTVSLPKSNGLAANALIGVESTASSSIEPARGWSIARLGAGVAEYAKPSDDAASAQNPIAPAARGRG